MTAKYCYEIYLHRQDQGTLPVTVTIKILADTEYEAATLAQRIAESQTAGVKSTAFELDAYPADFLRFAGVPEITTIDPGDDGGRVWDWERIENLLAETLVPQRNHLK